jgi:hypothetical protein
MVVVIVIAISAMIFVVPVSLVHRPSTVVVIVVRVAPVGAWIWWPVPPSSDPPVATAVDAPVTIDPDEAFSWNRGADLIAYGGWRSSDIDPDLSPCGHCKNRYGKNHSTAKSFRSGKCHSFAPFYFRLNFERALKFDAEMPSDESSLTCSFRVFGVLFAG